MKYLAWILLLLLACSKPKDIQVNLIPKPQHLTQVPGSFTLNYSTGIFNDSVFNSEADYLKDLLSIPLKGKRNNILLSHAQHLMKEEFVLNINKDTIHIQATFKEGMMRGIQTLRQLLPENHRAKGITGKIPCVQIHDFPRFQWRGMLLDCCRHFMDKKFVMRYIDLLAYHKMNVLHWHLTEDQGWRIAIDRYPKLTEIGSWRTEKNGEVYGGFYTKEDIKEIVSYAEKRHVMIVPEIELPGHSSAAIASYPFLSCTQDSIKVVNDWGVFKDIYCAGNDSVFLFLEDVLSEVIDLFPSKYIHIGGDEAPKYRWENCKKCQRRIKQEDLYDEHELQSYFIKRIEKFLNKNKKQLIGWDEILEGGLSSSATVQSWRGEDGGIKAAKSGNDAIMSPTSHCYFDYGLDAIDMKKVYHYEPIPEALTAEESNHILGGECNMWSERSPQELVDSKVFPRILAMSEVLWSEKEKNYSDFYQRVQKHYPKLDKMGVTYGFESVPITSSVVFSQDSFIVSLYKGSPDMRIEYRINSNDWKRYTNPFSIHESAILQARGFKLEKPYGEFTQEIIKNIATGKTVNYITSYNQNYRGTGDNNLTDGLVGSNDNFRDGYYQGFWGTDFEVIIDLEEIVDFSEIHTTFFQYHLSWIILPSQVAYLSSIDGENFTQIGSIQNDFSSMKEGKFKKDFSLEKKKITAKYLKVKATNFGKLPKEHPAAGSDAWIFVDEIIIK